MPKPSNVLNSSEKLDRPGRRAVRSDNGSVMVDILLTRETNASMYINKFPIFKPIHFILILREIFLHGYYKFEFIYVWDMCFRGAVVITCA